MTLWTLRLLTFDLAFRGAKRVVGWEEGGDDVKSAWLLRPGQHTYYNGRYRGSLSGNAELIPLKPVPVRIEV